MGFLDKAKKLVAKNDEHVKKAIGKAADLADKQTKGKHKDKIDDIAVDDPGQTEGLVESELGLDLAGGHVEQLAQGVIDHRQIEVVGVIRTTQGLEYLLMSSLGTIFKAVPVISLEHTLGLVPHYEEEGKGVLGR